MIYKLKINKRITILKMKKKVKKSVSAIVVWVGTKSICRNSIFWSINNL